MRIIYFLDESISLGGAAMTLLNQAALIKRTGHEAVVVSAGQPIIDVDRAFGPICAANGLELRCLAYPTSSQPEDVDVISLFECYDVLKEMVIDFAPDILHSVQLNPCVELVARDLNIPHVMNIYPAVSDFFKVKYTDIFPHYHICDSEYYSKKWRDGWHTGSVCIRTSAEAAISSYEKEFSAHFIRAVCVGLVYKEKNQLAVIRAFEKAIDQGVHGRLDIYGRSDNFYSEACRRYITDNGLDECVSVRGFCDDPRQIYGDADVLICGSTRESYPNVISEALANDVIVISTPVGGVPEVIKDGINGYICDDHTSDAICGKILEYRRDIESGRIDRIKKNARKTYQREHSPESVTVQLEGYYRKLLDDHVCDGNIKIDILKRLFAPTLETFYSHMDCFHNAEKVKKKLWYIYHVSDTIKGLIEQGRIFYIWGAAKNGMNVYNMMSVFFPQIKIEGFIDSNKAGEWMGLPVHSPGEILEQDGIILVGVYGGQHDILDMIKSYGKKYAEDYFIFAPRYW